MSKINHFVRPRNVNECLIVYETNFNSNKGKRNIKWQDVRNRRIRCSLLKKKIKNTTRIRDGITLVGRDGTNPAQKESARLRKFTSREAMCGKW